MQDLREFLQTEFNKINERFDRLENTVNSLNQEVHGLKQEINSVKHDIKVIYARLDRIDNRLEHIEHEIDDVKRVVRQSAEDILENQVEEIARHNLHEEKIRALEAKTFRLDKSFLELKQRVEKLERTNL